MHPRPWPTTPTRPPDDPGTAGEDTIIVPINDSTAGGTSYQPFEIGYSGTTPEGTPIYVYVPEGALDNPDPVGVPSLDPAFDHNLPDELVR